MTYAELLNQLMQLSDDKLQNDVILFDLYKGDGYGDAQFNVNDLTITFGEN